MPSEHITRRYNYKYSEIEEHLDILGKIDRVEPVTEYQKQNDASLKDVDVIVTTIENIEPEDDKKTL